MGSDLAAFHNLHVPLRKSKYRLLAQPLAFFETIAAHFSAAQAWHSLGAFAGSQMAASTVYLRCGDTLYYKFNASDPEFLHARPNNRLVWEGLKLAKSLGCRHLDLGPSDDCQLGLIRFKLGFGTQESELRHYRWTPPNWQPNPERLNILTDLTRTMTEPAVPTSAASAAGCALYRFFA